MLAGLSGFEPFAVAVLMALASFYLRAALGVVAAVQKAGLAPAILVVCRGCLRVAGVPAAGERHLERAGHALTVKGLDALMD